MEKFLDSSALVSELALRPGLIPVRIDVPRGAVVWEDLEGYHCYEGFFNDSLSRYRALRKTPPTRFRTNLRALDSSCDNTARLTPTAFVFHAGRCGSTLLARAFARSRSNMVLSEAPPHNQIWRVLPDDAPESVRLYRDLILTMGRRRLDSHRAHIIKFTSFNVVHFQFIRLAFPGVPALFLFRDPAAILASFERRAPEWIGKDLGRGLSWNSLETALEDFLRSAAAIRDPSFLCLNYANLTPASLPSILKFFGIEPTPPELFDMIAEFAWDSKTGLKRSPRADEGQPCYRLAPARLSALYRELLERESRYS